MAVISTMKIVGVVALVGSVQATTFLAPAQDIVLPASSSAKEPLQWLGANSPYFAGPNVNGISNEVPEGCTVEQVAYNARHGSRFPDGGAYNQWTALYAKIQAANFSATGNMAFLKEWEPVLTNPTLQIAQESPTGNKEAFDLGYQLRTRYPKLYAYGTPFITWSNLYPRVIQTAQNFVRGFLGSSASSLGQVITVNSTGSQQALFDTLSPSDLCPLYVDGNGGTPQTTWNNIYLPPILARLEAMIDGNLAFTESDVSIMPYLCGFESQITGTLSPWCSVFTDEELKQYEFSQDLRYYYGSGPGMDLPSKMMLPYLDSLVGLLSQGPGINGTYANGTSFTLPNIITAFMNDGQITQLGAATGVWDSAISLGDGTSIPEGYKYIASHFVTMRGTVAFERLNCAAPSASKEKRDAEKVVTITKEKTVIVTDCTETQTSTAAEITTKKPEMTTSTILKTSVYTITSCPPEVKNCPVGQKTSTIYTSTTVCPVEEASTTSAAQWTTSTVVKTSSYIISSCAHHDKHCTVGDTTSTVYTTTTVCSVEASTTSAPASWTTSTHTSTSTGKVTSCARGDKDCTVGQTTTAVMTSKTSHVVSTSATATATASGSASGSVTKTSSGSGSVSATGSNSGSASITASTSGSGSGYSNTTTLSSSSSRVTSSTYLNATTTTSYSDSTTSAPTSTSTSIPTSQTYIRILLNDAVYPVPSCQDGPGSSCLMSEYVKLIKSKVESAGDLVTRCNVTAANHPTKVRGASFFTDLSESWLGSVVP